MDETKSCTKCGAVKLLSEFYDRVRGGRKHHSWCKECDKISARAWFKTPRGRAATREWHRKNRLKNRDAINAKQRERRAANPDAYRSHDLKKKHGITLAEKQELLRKQGSRCAICRCSEPNTKKMWFLDHDHDTNRVRGVLCGRCNSMLGYSTDDPSHLIAGARYLVEHRSVGGR